MIDIVQAKRMFHSAFPTGAKNKKPPRSARAGGAYTIFQRKDETSILRTAQHTPWQQLCPSAAAGAEPARVKNAAPSHGVQGARGRTGSSQPQHHLYRRLYKYNS